MSIKVNCREISQEHSFHQVCAFIDTEGDFYLIDEDGDKIVRLTNRGCVVYNTNDYENIEDFFDVEFGGDCKILKIFTYSNEYEIIVNG